jgi:DNA polymerase-3 subunit gamma/tau
VVTALYRRYRPENFAELIGQAQVTAPLMTALRADRVNHAYLFSGPRGCGKTTSARILARCLNCAEGPTDTPCGKCPSCIELARDGGGSLDVVEIDAASHNGVDDARDLRERAAFAPSRDRYKIFILDEAHMVTAAGFNALLKIVEEPPAHVKFIFATTEPEKVISTIRSRTHHYPFRLVPPAQMLDYLEQMCVQEGVEVAPGVLPLVVRSGGGSVRDSLSLLDQLIAGSQGSKVEYARAVALLGYTPDNLLDEAVNALSIKEPSAAFSAVDRVIQSGQDPRQFVEDILERLRDLMLVNSVGNEAKSVLRGVSDEQLENMRVQASRFGVAELSHAADVVNDALTQMSGATSPKLHLELMIGRVLVPAADQSEVGSLARIERLERRIGIASDAASASAPVPASQAPEPAATVTPAKSQMSAPAPAAEALVPAAKAVAPEPTAKTVSPAPAAAAPTAVAALTTAQFRDSWNAVLSLVEKKSKSAWVIAYTLSVVDFTDEVLTLRFASQNDLESFKSAGQAPEILREAIRSELGVTVKFKPHVDQAALTTPIAVVEAPTLTDAPASTETPALVEAPAAQPEPVAAQPEPAAAQPEPAAEQPEPPTTIAPAKARKAGVPEDERYGESILREFGAKPLDNPSGGR